MFPRRKIRSLDVEQLHVLDDLTYGGRALAPTLAPGNVHVVDTFVGNDTYIGTNMDKPLATVATALAHAEPYDTILIKGDVREELVGSHELFDLTFIGMGNRPRHAVTGYAGASVWRPPASPTTATPLIKVRAQGWRFVNLLFDCPVDAAAVYLERNAIDGTASGEYDASHAGFYGCRFESGLVGIQNAGGCGFVEVDGNRFYRLSGSGAAGIKCTSTAVAVPLNWQIENNVFIENASHILSSLAKSELVGNRFGYATAAPFVSVAYNSSQGDRNHIFANYLYGTYNATNYPAGTNNEWAGNYVIAGITTANPT